MDLYRFRPKLVVIDDEQQETKTRTTVRSSTKYSQYAWKESLVRMQPLPATHNIGLAEFPWCSQVQELLTCRTNGILVRY